MNDERGGQVPGDHFSDGLRDEIRQIIRAEIRDVLRDVLRMVIAESDRGSNQIRAALRRGPRSPGRRRVVDATIAKSETEPIEPTVVYFEQYSIDLNAEPEPEPAPTVVKWRKQYFTTGWTPRRAD